MSGFKLNDMNRGKSDELRDIAIETLKKMKYGVFKDLFEVAYPMWKERKPSRLKGGEEIVRLRFYSVLQDLVLAGDVKRDGQIYRWSNRKTPVKKAAKTKKRKS